MDKTLKYEDLLSISEGAGYEKLPASYKVAIEVGVKCALKPHDVTDEDMNLLGKRTRKKRFSVGLSGRCRHHVQYHHDGAGIPMDEEYRRHLPADFD